MSGEAPNLPLFHQASAPSPWATLTAIKHIHRSRWRRFVFPLAFLCLILWAWPRQYWLRNLLTYSTRPLYDRPQIPRNTITHIHAPGIPQNDAAACKRHGWDVWARPSKVVDAVIFSVEIDLLEIRLAELSPITSDFFILESTSTFTGLPKPLVLAPYLAENATDTRFHPYLSKIRYRAISGRALRAGEDPFNIEREMREAMQFWLESAQARLNEGDLILMSDVDEIPSMEALTLIASCNAPSPIHLALSQHLYTFQHSLSPLPPSWRARAVRYVSKQTPYVHSLSGPNASMLSDAGWHCSFCFRTIGDFVFKARGFSHTDRLGTRSDLLTSRWIQKAVCEGKDFFGMLPEAFDWGSLISRWGGAGKREFGSLPKELVKGGREKWGWLIGTTSEGKCQERDWARGEEWKFGDVAVS